MIKQIETVIVELLRENNTRGLSTDKLLNYTLEKMETGEEPLCLSDYLEARDNLNERIEEREVIRGEAHGGSGKIETVRLFLKY